MCSSDLFPDYSDSFGVYQLTYTIVELYLFGFRRAGGGVICVEEGDVGTASGLGDYGDESSIGIGIVNC